MQKAILHKHSPPVYYFIEYLKFHRLFTIECIKRILSIRVPKPLYRMLSVKEVKDKAKDVDFAQKITDRH